MMPDAAPASCVIAGQGGEVAANLLGRRLAERVRDCGGLRIIVARTDGSAAILPRPIRRRWTVPRRHAEFAVRRLAGKLIVTARTTAGTVHGAGWVLRQIETVDGRAHYLGPASVDAAPAYLVRMTQIGYRAKNNSYDAWTLPMFQRRIEDFALWGASGIQLIAPVSDDAPTSPLFPAPAPETLAGIAGIAQRLGLEVALYYPELRDYRDPGAVAAELADFTRTLALFPRLDALYVPGGDPGHSPPDTLFPLVARQAALLRQRDPHASVWISTQGFDAAGLAAFYRQLDRRPRWLTGVFVGPQTRDPLALQRRRIPARYPIILYPDIGHVMHAQFPVPAWWPEFALTEGREPINPRPLGYADIFRRLAPMTSGFVTYSEGVNDDFNQFLWFALGWDPAIGAREIAAEYARSFIGDPRAAGVPFALEANWVGDPARNRSIEATLALVDSLRPAAFADWRIDSLRYRALYDAIVRRRTMLARTRLAAAYAALAKGDAAAAKAALAQPDDAKVGQLRARLLAVAGQLHAAARLQLSAPLYGASSVERGANLDRVDVDLTGRAWLDKAIDAAPDRVALMRLADRSRAAEGALYDDLGRPDAEPHLVRGAGFALDPQMRRSAIDGIADRTPDDGWLPSQIDYAESLYDRPIRLHYDGLDGKRRYRLVATYAGEDYALPMRLVANGRYEIHSPLARTSNPMTVEFAIPHAATKSGRLDLAWTRPPGLGGSGRGHQLAETWLIPEPITGAPQ